MTEAPLYVQSHAVALWLISNPPARGPLEKHIHGLALHLVDHVILALKGFDRDRNIEDADASAVLLRAHLKLALDAGLIDDRQFLYITDEIISIGRQIGGWQRKIERGTVHGRHR